MLFSILKCLNSSEKGINKIFHVPSFSGLDTTLPRSKQDVHLKGSWVRGSSLTGKYQASHHAQLIRINLKVTVKPEPYSSSTRKVSWRVIIQFSAVQHLLQTLLDTPFKCPSSLEPSASQPIVPDHFSKDPLPTALRRTGCSANKQMLLSIQTCEDA